MSMHALIFLPWAVDVILLAVSSSCLDFPIKACLYHLSARNKGMVCHSGPKLFSVSVSYLCNRNGVATKCLFIKKKEQTQSKSARGNRSNRQRG